MMSTFTEPISSSRFVNDSEPKSHLAPNMTSEVRYRQNFKNVQFWKLPEEIIYRGIRSFDGVTFHLASYLHIDFSISLLRDIF